MCFNFTHILMNIVGSIELHESLRTFSIRIVWQRKTVKSILVTMQGKKIQRICKKKTIKMKNNAVQNKNTIPRVYCLPRSLEHIFPGIIKTFHSDKRSDNKQLTVSINHNRTMHPPKLFSALSLIQSNMHYQTKKCIPEILLDIINSYISL